MSSLIVEICEVLNVIPHENADKLDCVMVKGWNCIVGKNQYKQGDLVVFVPPDCIIPDAIIEKYNLSYLKGNNRTGTIKLRGIISQGLILDVPDGKYKIGDDVSNVLGIKKYEVPEPKYNPRSGNNPISKKKMNPFFDKYTDIENVKNYQNVFKNGDMVVISEKCHGTNWRCGTLPIIIDFKQPFFYLIRTLFQKYILGQKFESVYGSHNVQLNYGNTHNTFYGDNVYGKICEKYNTKNIPEFYVVYGEIIGKGIQDLTYGLSGIDMCVFDVKYKDKYLGWKEVKEFCNKFGFQTVPELYVGEYYDGILDKYTDGKSVICPTQIREGCVIKTLVDEINPRIGRKILKSVSAIYLTRKNGTEFK